MAKILTLLVLLLSTGAATAETAAKRLAEFKLLGHWANENCATKPSNWNTHTVIMIADDGSAQWIDIFGTGPNQATLIKIDLVEKLPSGLISIRGRQLPSNGIVALVAVKSGLIRVMSLRENDNPRVVDGVIFNGAETQWFKRCN